MSEVLQIVRQVLDSQPFSVLLGARISAVESKAISIELPVRAELLQQHGFVHGGVLSYLADNALTFAGGLALGSKIVTSEYKINYVRPAVGELLVARAGVVYAGSRQAVCRCDVFVQQNGTEKLVATAQGTISTQAD